MRVVRCCRITHLSSLSRSVGYKFRSSWYHRNVVGSYFVVQSCVFVVTVFVMRCLEHKAGSSRHCIAGFVASLYCGVRRVTVLRGSLCHCIAGFVASLYCGVRRVTVLRGSSRYCIAGFVASLYCGVRRVTVLRGSSRHCIAGFVASLYCGVRRVAVLRVLSQFAHTIRHSRVCCE